MSDTNSDRLATLRSALREWRDAKDAWGEYQKAGKWRFATQQQIYARISAAESRLRALATENGT